jgi:putative ABC transport system ATP-binding protein
MMLETRDVRKCYQAGTVEVWGLRGVSLQVKSGEFLSIMGPSGCGKSTLLHLLGAVDTPTSGDVLLQGENLARLGDTERSVIRRRRLGFVFQRMNLLASLTAEDNVALPLRIDGMSRNAARRRAREVLDQVGMSERVRHFPHEMSGGQQQRVAIARALVVRPAVILADEPTGALDSENGREVVRLLRHCVAGGQTVIVVTHDLQVARQTDRLLLMQDGVLVAEKTAGELERFGGFEDQRHVAPAMGREVVPPQPRLDSSE